MTVESAADRAVFFDSAGFALAGTYSPTGGPAVAVVVILDQPDQTVALGALGSTLPKRIAWLRASELVAAPARGDTVTIGTKNYTVMKAELDIEGAIYRLDLS